MEHGCTSLSIAPPLNQDVQGKRRQRRSKGGKSLFLFFNFKNLLNVQAAERAPLINWVSAGKHLNYGCGVDTLSPLIQGDVGRKLQLLARSRLQVQTGQTGLASLAFHTWILDFLIFYLGWTVCQSVVVFYCVVVFSIRLDFLCLLKQNDLLLVSVSSKCLFLLLFPPLQSCICSSSVRIFCLYLFESKLVYSERKLNVWISFFFFYVCFFHCDKACVKKRFLN